VVGVGVRCDARQTCVAPASSPFHGGGEASPLCSVPAPSGVEGGGLEGGGLGCVAPPVRVWYTVIGQVPQIRHRPTMAKGR